MLTRILFLILNFSSLALYLYTIYYAYNSIGLIAAFFSASLPVVANVYWMYAITMDTGDLMNDYNLACVAVLVILGIFLLFMFLSKDENLNDN